jgi:hypothetical protein
VLTRDFIAPEDIYVRKDAAPANRVLNKFTVQAIFNELERVLENRSFSHRGLVMLDDDTWWDPQTVLTKPLPWARACRLRDAIEATVA